MKRISTIITALILVASTAIAQNKPAETVTLTTDQPDKSGMLILGKKDSATKNTTYLSLGTGGVKVTSKKQDSINKKKTVEMHWLMFDLGINALNDRTNYNDAAAQQYLQVPGDKKNGNLFSLRQGKSINVNIWPVLMNIKLMQSHGQKISLYTGAGLQLYNFKFNRDISYVNETRPMVIEDNVRFSKNKLAFAYVSIPMMFNFKTRMGGSNLWLTYGFGAIGGYCFDSWTKQISDERGKQKNHDEFNFQKFNLNLSGEIGIVNYIRFYATYQVTNLYKDALVQNPYCIGIRFFGI